LTQEQIDKEKKRWEVGIEAGIQRFKVHVAKEIDRIGRLTRPTEKPKRFSLLKKSKLENPDYRELREEFRSFLRTTKDNVDLYLWFALSNLAERSVDRKLESKVYRLFGDVASTFLYIEQNFDPSKVTTDLLSFLKDRITRIGSPGAFDIQGYASTIKQSGEGERPFLESVNSLQKLLAEVRWDLSKYFKKDEAFEAEAREAMKNG
jgi:hypothetical protein